MFSFIYFVFFFFFWGESMDLAAIALVDQNEWW